MVREVSILTTDFTGTVEDRVLDVSSRKRLGDLKDPQSPTSPTKGDPYVGLQLDQAEAIGLQQHLGKLVERHGVGEVVETGELWNCLFGNSNQQRARIQEVLKEVQRDQRASAAENRQGNVMVVS
jgi:E3 ubiquitin-protein ligase SHPRH